MPGETVAAAPARGGPLHHVDVGPVGLDEVQVGGAEVPERVPEVTGQGHRLEEDLREEDRGADVQVNPASTQARDLSGEGAEVQMGRPAQSRRIAGGMHVYDVGPDRHVDGRGETQPAGRRHSR